MVLLSQKCVPCWLNSWLAGWTEKCAVEGEWAEGRQVVAANRHKRPLILEASCSHLLVSPTAKEFINK
jgi:hypothetical protein